MELTTSQRKAVTKVIVTRYLRVSKVEKGRILDELCATTGWHCVSELITHFRVLLANIVGFPGGWSVPVVAVPGKPVNPGLFEPGLAALRMASSRPSCSSSGVT